MRRLIRFLGRLGTVQQPFAQEGLISDMTSFCFAFGPFENFRVKTDINARQFARWVFGGAPHPQRAANSQRIFNRAAATVQFFCGGRAQRAQLSVRERRVIRVDESALFHFHNSEFSLCVPPGAR